ncbi:DUF4214 domain-containing protein [Pseudomaricurvus alkylphenolicus]|uniref:DUF4214 domain-containing protein n=1 Tax=Pseudomaricurvus alkylphenolicus TaxID=1306991 RepID=UPI001423D77A|nr:DUF4214 domain-containing protein [Pseudomaricurvus alkylphenolicus]NIB40151.1 DUF4214 domain-containing protein [Pseudomaricurvus alkylphenolicus]
MPTVSEQIQQIFMGLLGRPAADAGLAYWAEEIESGHLTLEQFRANIVNEQPEYLQGQGSMSREEMVIDLYHNLFNREPNPEGLEYWVSGGGAGVNADQLVLALINGAGASDQFNLAKKIEAVGAGIDSDGQLELLVAQDTTLDELLAMVGVDVGEVKQLTLLGSVTLTLSADQAYILASDAIDIEYLSPYDFDNSIIDVTPTIEIDVAQDLQLSEMSNLEANPDVHLVANISNEAVLTLSAEQLAGVFVNEGVRKVAGQQGKVVVVDADIGFQPYFSVDPCDVLHYDYAGSLSDSFDTANDIEIQRSLTGFDRPLHDGPYSYFSTIIINFPESPLIDISRDSYIGNELIITASEDLTFLQPVELGSGFSVDFSALEGQLLGMSLLNFHEVKVDDIQPVPAGCEHWIIQGNNSGTRIDIGLGGNVEGTGHGFSTAGVPIYMVTSLYDAADGEDLKHHIMFSSDSRDIEILGLKSNPLGTVSFLNVPTSTHFLMEGDGLQTFSGGYDSIGSLSASYAELVEQSVVTVTSLAESFAPRTLKVAGIDINNTERLQVDVVGGDSVIESLAGDSVKNLVLSSSADVTLAGGLVGLPELESVDASRVTGKLTLQMADCHNNFTNVTLTGIDAIEIPHGGYLSMNASQLDQLSEASWQVMPDEFGQQQAVLNIHLEQDATLSEMLDLSLLGEHLQLQVYVANGATLTLSAEQLDKYFTEAGVQYAEGNVVITDAGLDFNPYTTVFTGVKGGTLPAGTSLESPSNVTLLQSEDGYERTPVDLEGLKSLGSGTWTFSADFIEAVGVENFLPAEGAEVTVNVTDLNDHALDLDLMAGNGINVGLVTIWAAGAELHAETTLGGADTVLIDPLVMDATLEMTAAQFQGIDGGSVVSGDSDCGYVANVLIDQLEALENVGDSSDRIDIDFGGVSVSGSSTLLLGALSNGQYATVAGGNADVALSDSSILGGFIVGLYDFNGTGSEIQAPAGERIIFTTAEQAGRAITVLGNGASDRDTRVVWDSSFFNGTIDASGYGQELGAIQALDSLVSGVDIESLIEGLHADIPLQIFSVESIPGFPSYLHRQIVVEPFAQVPEDAFLNQQPEFSAESVSLTLQGGSSIGDFPLAGVIAPNAGNVNFSSLKISSEFMSEQGETPLPGDLNVVGDIRAGENAGLDLMNIALNTYGAQLAIGAIEFSSVVGENTAVLTTGGDAAIEIVSLNLIDGDIETLRIAMSGIADVSLLGTDAEAAIIGESLRLIEISGSGSGSVNLSVIDGVSPDDFRLANQGADVVVDATLIGEMDGSAFEAKVVAYDAALQAFEQAPSEAREATLLGAYQTLAAAADNPDDFVNYAFGAAVSAGDSGTQENISVNYTWNLDLQEGDQITFTSDTRLTAGRLNLGGADLIIEGEVDMSTVAALDGVGGLLLTAGSQLILPQALLEELDLEQQLILASGEGSVILSAQADGLYSLAAESIGDAAESFNPDTDSVLIPHLVSDNLRGDGTLFQLGDVAGEGFVLNVDAGLLVNTGSDVVDLEAASQMAELVLLNTQINGFDAFYYLTDNGVDSALFLFDDGNGNSAVDEGEVSHILTLAGVADATVMSSENFADFM